MNKFLKLLLSALLLVILIPFTGSTEEVYTELPEIVVTATKLQEPEEEVTQDVIVITAEEIRQRGYHFVSDVIRSISDINLVQNGGAGKNATVFLRGGSPNQVVVMIDGVKVKSTTTGSFDFSGLSVDEIERIEIVLGPQSTLYGSEAMAGVINIITKRGRGKPSINVSSEIGSYGTFKTSMLLLGATERFDYRFSGAYFNTGGFSAAASGYEPDGYENKSLSMRLGARVLKNTLLELSVRYYKDWSELDGYEYGVGVVDDLNYIQKGEHLYLATKAQGFITDRYEQIFTVAAVRDKLRFEDPDTEFNNAEIDTEMETIEWQHNLYLNNLTLTAGAEYREESGDNKGNFNSTVDNRALYFNTKVVLIKGNLILNAGARYDDHELAGSKVTYRTALVFRLPEQNMTFRTSYATGFRAPTLNELFFPYFGNPELRPEKSRGFDVELKKGFLNNRFRMGITYFYQRYTDLIEYDFATYSAQNIGRARIKGVRLTSEFLPAESLKILLSYTNLDAEDMDSGDPLTRRPQHKLVVKGTYTKGRLLAGSEIIYVSKRYDSAADRHLSSYTVVNLFGQYRLNNFITVFSRLDNLFNKDYEEAGGYNAAGASVYGGIRVKL